MSLIVLRLCGIVPIHKVGRGLKAFIVGKLLLLCESEKFLIGQGGYPLEDLTSTVGSLLTAFIPLGIFATGGHKSKRNKYREKNEKQLLYIHKHLYFQINSIEWHSRIKVDTTYL